MAEHRRLERGVCPAPPHWTNVAAPLQDYPPPSQRSGIELSGAIHRLYCHHPLDDEKEAQMRFYQIDSEMICRTKKQGMNVWAGYFEHHFQLHCYALLAELLQSCDPMSPLLRKWLQSRLFLTMVLPISASTQSYQILRLVSSTRRYKIPHLRCKYIWIPMHLSLHGPKLVKFVVPFSK